MNLDTLAQLNIAVAFFFPLVAALVKQQGWSTQVNAAVSFLLAALVAVITTAAEGQVSWENWGESLVLIFTVAVAAYRGLWSPLGADEAIKNATSFVKGGSEG